MEVSLPYPCPLFTIHFFVLGIEMGALVEFWLVGQGMKMCILQ